MQFLKVSNFLSFYLKTFTQRRKGCAKPALPQAREKQKEKTLR